MESATKYRDGTMVLDPRWSTAEFPKDASRTTEQAAADNEIDPFENRKLRRSKTFHQNLARLGNEVEEAWKRFLKSKVRNRKLDESSSNSNPVSGLRAL